MINKMFITIAILLVSTVISMAQTEFSLFQGNRISDFDSLIISRENGQKISLIWDYRKNIHKKVHWYQLLSDFQTDFNKVVNDIPNYDYYKINYDTKSLIVDEIVGRETFNVTEENGIEYIKSNSCQLFGKNLRMIIEFNQFDELLDPSLQQDILTAIAEVKNKFYISNVISESHYYDIKTNSKIKTKRDYKFFIPLGAQLGLLRNEPYIEFRPGLGIIENKRLYGSLNLGIVSRYNSENQSTEFDYYIGLASGTVGPGISSEFAFKVSSGIEEFDDIVFRSGLNYKTKGGITLGVQYYAVDSNAPEMDQGIDFGFSLGIGF